MTSTFTHINKEWQIFLKEIVISLDSTVKDHFECFKWKTKSLTKSNIIKELLGSNAVRM